MHQTCLNCVWRPLVPVWRNLHQIAQMYFSHFLVFICVHSHLLWDHNFPPVYSEMCLKWCLTVALANENVVTQHAIIFGTQRNQLQCSWQRRYQNTNQHIRGRRTNGMSEHSRAYWQNIYCIKALQKKSLHINADSVVPVFQNTCIWYRTHL